jgi:putative ABC transport system permease protein
MNDLAQIAAVTMLNLRTLPQRLGNSLVIVIGIAGVVAVLVSMLSMSVGFREAIANGASDDRAIILTRGVLQESLAAVSRAEAVDIENLPGIRRTPAGKPALSAELVALASVSRKSDGSDAFVSLRGVGATAFFVRPEWKLIAGRMYRLAEREVLVGKSAQAQFAHLEVGDTILLGDGDWTVVGVFESGGSAHESMLLADAEAVLAAFKLKAFNSVTVLLDSGDAFMNLRSAIVSLPASSLEARRESEYFAAQSQPQRRLLEFVAYLVAGIMAIGAVFGALNTMYSAVSVRGAEIATLRALGFSGASVVVSVLIEAQLLALVGAMLGVAIAHVAFNGQAISTVADTMGHNPQVVFALTIDAGLIVTSIALACVVGLIGGLFPAVRAARMPIVAALRATN